MSRRSLEAFPVAILAFAAVGCADIAGSGIAGFALTVGDTVMVLEGTTRDLGVLDGASSASGVTWTSRDPTVATVAAGVVTAVKPGETWVVGKVRSFSDSVRVTTRVAGLALAESRFFLRGDVNRDVTGYTNARSYEVIGTSQYDRAQVNMWDQRIEAFIFFPAHLTAGTSTLLPFSGSLFATPTQVAAGVRMDGGAAGPEVVYRSTGGRTVIESITPAAGGGPTRVRGYAAYNATGFLVDRSSDRPVVTPTGRRVKVFAEFNAALRADVAGVIDLTIQGGPFGQTTTRLFGSADAWAGNLEVLADDGIGANRFQAAALIEGQGLGTRPLGDALRFGFAGGPEPGSFFVLWDEAAATASSYYIADSANEGTITVMSYLPGSAEARGSMSGTLAATMTRYELGSALTPGPQFAVTGTFTLPVVSYEAAAAAGEETMAQSAGAGAMPTSSVRRASPWFETPCGSPAGAHTRVPGPTRLVCPPTTKSPVPSSTK